MSAWFIESPVVILLVSILLVTFVTMLTKAIILPAFGIDWPFRAVRIPVRFSIRSVTVLIALTAGVLSLLRQAPGIALFGLTIVFVTWLTVVRYLAFRRKLADASHRELATMIPTITHLTTGQRRGCINSQAERPQDETRV